MRSVALLVLLAGCDLVFDLHGPRAEDTSIQLRRAFGGDTVMSMSLAIERPPEVEPDDLVLAVIQAPNNDNTDLLTKPSGLSVVAESFADRCDDSWHAWFLRGTAGTDPSYEFSFDNQANHVGVMVAYANAGSASLITQVNPSDLITADLTTLDLPASPTQPGSIMWIGAVASMRWTDLFSAGSKQQVQQNLAMFDLEVKGATIPPVTYDLPAAARVTCPAVAQMRIEP